MTTTTTLIRPETSLADLATCAKSPPADQETAG